MDKTEGVTSKIRDVQAEAHSRWDNELNRVYGELQKNSIMKTRRNSEKLSEPGSKLRRGV